MFNYSTFVGTIFQSPTDPWISSLVFLLECRFLNLTQGRQSRKPLSPLFLKQSTGFLLRIPIEDLSIKEILSLYH